VWWAWRERGGVGCWCLVRRGRAGVRAIACMGCGLHCYGTNLKRDERCELKTVVVVDATRDRRRRVARGLGRGEVVDRRAGCVVECAAAVLAAKVQGRAGGGRGRVGAGSMLTAAARRGRGWTATQRRLRRRAALIMLLAVLLRQCGRGGALTRS